MRDGRLSMVSPGTSWGGLLLALAKLFSPRSELDCQAHFIGAELFANVLRAFVQVRDTTSVLDVVRIDVETWLTSPSSCEQGFDHSHLMLPESKLSISVKTR
jgi:hypothetical protein